MDNWDPNDWLAFYGGILAAVVALTVLWRSVVRPVARWLKRGGEKLNRAFDVLLGTAPVPDPDRPGELLHEGTPDIGVRMTRTETLLQVVLMGAVEDSKDAAKKASESAAAAHAIALALTERVDENRARIDELEKTYPTPPRSA